MVSFANACVLVLLAWACWLLCVSVSLVAVNDDDEALQVVHASPGALEARQPNNLGLGTPRCSVEKCRGL